MEKIINLLNEYKELNINQITKLLNLEKSLVKEITDKLINENKIRILNPNERRCIPPIFVINK